MREERIEQLQGVLAWFANVREEALSVGPELAAQPVDNLETYLSSEPRARTVGAFQHLLDVANRELHHDPRRARALTSFVLDHIHDVNGPEATAVPLLLFKARAWREHANALHATNDLKGALASASHASALLATNGACSFDRAIVQMVEAHIAWERGDIQRALDTIRESCRTFEELRDQKRYVQARVFEGMFEFTYNKRRAAEIFESVLPAAAELRDAREMACLYQNLFQCALELDDHELASRAYAHAKELFAALTMDADMPRIWWGYGRYLARRGKLEEALAEFQSARQAFENHGMALAAAAAALDVVHTLQALGRTPEAQTICRSLVPTFSEAGILPAALTALAILREQADTLKSAMVERVRDFIEGLEQNPYRRFPEGPHA